MQLIDLIKTSKLGKIVSDKLSPFSNVYTFSSKRVIRDGPAFAIKEKIVRGQIKSDSRQTPVIKKLQDVYEQIDGYTPGRYMSSSTPKGLYIYGSVGAGKTMLMDLFYHTVKTRSKRRSHFNDFMVDVHSRIHTLKKKKPRSSRIWNDEIYPADPITPVAKELVKEAWLLCFDEFQVTDIADAMILKRLFTEMFENGMVMVATSNRAPDDLYKNGLQRSNFLPFIPVLKYHCNVVSISGKDYRMTETDGIEEHYLIEGEPGTKSAMAAAFNKLCAIEKRIPERKTLKILGHKVNFPNTCGRVLFTSFKELCDKPLGTTDYIQIAKNFDTVFIKNVPKMNMNTRNQARRFILLIDTLYDYKKRIMISAEAPPNDLFSGLTGKPIDEDQERALMDDLRIERGSENAKSSLFSGSEEVFAFRRTVSRINEMCSKTYWNRYSKNKY